MDGDPFAVLHKHRKYFSVMVRVADCYASDLVQTMVRSVNFWRNIYLVEFI